MPDEASTRRPDFSDGPKVALGDGQIWTLPRPWLRLYPTRDGDGRIGVGGGPSFGAEFEDLIDELTDCDPDDHAGRLAVQFRMTAALLLRNYDLTDRDLRRLLVVDAEDPDCRDRWAKINLVLTGRSPKPSADGSAAR
ncbi:MAG: hypothetical protein P4L85_19810 [Paludisphaera borealis]|uniref:hypothetical protein n=1 Tax=Paludisphaera borealis TaxID=1387353 RepID=UPI00283FA76E|nr:hypothetical protein [Paludisphaera borealis]MDR3621607.1 hypothetical protein [Paludisphaera borealis]